MRTKSRLNMDTGKGISSCMYVQTKTTYTFSMSNIRKVLLIHLTIAYFARTIHRCLAITNIETVCNKLCTRSEAKHICGCGLSVL